MEKTDNTIKQHVLDSIKSGDCKMKPKWHFMVKTTLLVLASISLALFVIYIASLLVFFLRVTGAVYGPQFGLKGITIMFISLPWVLVLLLLAMVVILEFFVRKFPFAYRRPAIYTLLFIILAVTASAAAISRLSLHNKLYKQVEDTKTPISHLYIRIVEKDIDVHGGIVTELEEKGFHMDTRKKPDIFVIVTSNTQLPKEHRIAVQDKVIVFGEEDDGVIKALGVKHVYRLPEPMHPRKILPKKPVHQMNTSSFVSTSEITTR